MKKNVNGFETLEKINFYPGEQIVIGYHDDMDGMLAAVAVKHAIKQLLLLGDTGITFQKMQYHKDRTTGLDGLIGKKLVILVDFCIPRSSEFRELKENGLEQIHVYDHHRTAMDFIEMISLEPEFNYVKYFFDLSRSGCSIAYDEFISYFVSIDKTNVGVSKLNWLQSYAADYDLCKFELENSKNINAGLKIIAQKLGLLKNPEVMYNFVFGEDTQSIYEIFGEDSHSVELEFLKYMDSMKEREDCVDSWRIGLTSSKESMDEYWTYKTCCGSDDTKIKINNKEYMFGCNYGH